MRRTATGNYTPVNKDKYKGTLPIVYRSSWERDAFFYLDRNPNIKYWGSESVIIPYMSPIDNKAHKYYIDLVFTTVKNEKYIVEIKPHSQVAKPIKGRKRESTFLSEAKTWVINISKWKAASAYAKSNGFIFKIWTERGVVDPILD